MIEMNRITRLLHLASFLKRQRRAVGFSKRYVVSDRDLLPEKQGKQSALSHDEVAALVLKDFDPEKDERDRRLLFEVTQLRLDDNDFRDQTSSEEEASAELQGYSGLDSRFAEDLKEAENDFVLNKSQRLV